MIDATDYKNVMGSFPSGVTVITTLNDEGEVVGLTASAFSSLSMDPPLVLFCPNYSSDSYATLIKSKRFAIHLLRPAGRSLRVRPQRQAKSRRHRVDIERTGQSTVEQRHGDHRVRTVARVRRWRSRDHGRRDQEPDSAATACRPDGVLPRQDEHLACSGLSDFTLPTHLIIRVPI